MKGVWDWLNSTGEKIVGFFSGAGLAAAVAPQPTLEEITEAKNDPEYAESIGITFKPLKIPIVSDLVTGIGNTLKNIPVYIFAIIAVIGVYLILMGRKGKSVL